jgi:hypothetical protein
MHSTYNTNLNLITLLDHTKLGAFLSILLALFFSNGIAYTIMKLDSSIHLFHNTWYAEALPLIPGFPTWHFPL